MKKQSTFLYVLRLALTLLLITSCMAAALAGVNKITEPIIAKANEAKTQAAINAVLPGGGEAVAFTDATGVVTKVYGSDTGYAVQVTPSGFDGEIDMMVGIDKDGKVLYFSLNQFNNAPSVKETLTNYAAKHIAFDSVSFDYYDSIYYPNYTFLRLLGPGGEADRIGYVRTAYDEAHTAYTVVVNERTGEIWVEPGTWKY